MISYDASCADRAAVIFESANISKATSAIISGLDDMSQDAVRVKFVIFAMVMGNSGDKKLT
jgi:hypothetical protein